MNQAVKARVWRRRSAIVPSSGMHEKEEEQIGASRLRKRGSKENDKGGPSVWGVLRSLFPKEF